MHRQHIAVVAMGAAAAMLVISGATRRHFDVEPIDLQIMLLPVQVLQHHRYHRVGGNGQGIGRELHVLRLDNKDLSGMIPTPGVLQELLVPLAQKIRGGAYGSLVLVVCTADQAVADLVGYLASAHDLAMFVTSAPENLRDAIPVGDLTPSDRASLETLADLGGQATASQFAFRAGLEQTAAGNRLVNLAKKGYICASATICFLSTPGGSARSAALSAAPRAVAGSSRLKL